MPDPSSNAEARLSACLAVVFALEGGYADNPADPGGATNMGITRRTLAAWRRIVPWTALDVSEVRALTRAEASDIYAALYWSACGAPDLPAGVDLAVFDYAVHSGPGRAVRTLQRLVGVAADGVVGPVTRAAVLERDPVRLVDALCDQRLGFLERLASFVTFGRGWTARVATVRAHARTMAAAGAKSPSQPERTHPVEILSGYRTYIVAALMALAALAQVLGIDVPGIESQSTGHLLMEAFAIIFLRRGIATAAK